MHAFVLSAIMFSGGLFSLAGAWFDWDWFMNAANARPLVELTGRKAARIIYALLGVALIIFGLLFVTGVLHLPDRAPRVSAMLYFRAR